jgi:hypothetical protein
MGDTKKIFFETPGSFKAYENVNRNYEWKLKVKKSGKVINTELD